MVRQRWRALHDGNAELSPARVLLGRAAMSSSEARARVRILRAVASADGEIVGTERLAIGVLAGEQAAEAKSSLDLEAEIERVRSEDARRTTFAAAVAIANVDGECNGDEHVVLDRIRAAFHTVEPQELALAEAEWRARLRLSRAELADADAEFLRRIASFNGALSMEIYAALVEGLRARRARILRGTLAPLIAFDP